MRTIVDIPESEIRLLDRLCHSLDISRAEAVRRAVHLYLEETLPDFEAAYGIWKKKKIDPLKYERKLRSEWE